MFQVIVEEKYGEQRIVGYIDNHEVIVLWVVSKQVGLSTTLPSRIEEAKIYMACYNAVFNKYDEIIKEHKQCGT